MMAMTTAVPRRPTPFAKAVFAVAMAKVTQQPAEKFLHKVRDEKALVILTRADQTAGSTTAAGWAAEVSRDAFRDFLTDLQPYAAAARLIELAVRAEVGPMDASLYPVRTGGPTIPAWVNELGEIPVRSIDFDLLSIGPPKKMSHILAFSRELSKRSDAERIFMLMLKEDVAAGIDAAFFATTAGSATQPAGLLFGVTPTTPSGSGGYAALVEDLAALGSAVATGGSGNVLYVMSPARLAMARILAPEVVAVADIAVSAAVPADRVVAVDGAALLIAIDGEPEIRQSDQAVIHVSDVPLPIVSGAGVAADPTRSLWQSATKAVRIIHEIDFIKRRSTAVAYLDIAGWN